LNMGVTASPLKTPYQLYAEQDSPNLSFGFGHTGRTALRSTLAQKSDFYREFLTPQIEAHRPANVLPTLWNVRLPLLAKVTTPTRLLLLLFPLSVLGLAARWRWVLWSMLVLYLILYTFFPFMLSHYVIVPAPAVVLGILIGKSVVERWTPQKWRAAAQVFLTLAVAALALRELPEFDREKLDDGYDRPTMRFASNILPRQVGDGSIVLFRYRTGDLFHEEPVYNVDVLWPDDAPIIRAHDLGVERDRELFDYYAKRQPQRNVFLYDRATRTLASLGSVVDLARRFPATQPANGPPGPSSSGPM